MRVDGFTLVELVVTVAVLAVVTAVAVPSFENLIERNRLATQTNSLSESLNLARSEAIRRREAAAICASEDGARCEGDWDQGWIVFMDGDRDGEPADATDVVRAWSPSDDDAPEIVAPAVIRYEPSGQLDARSAQFEVKGKKDARCLTLLPTGSIRPQKGRCGRA